MAAFLMVLESVASVAHLDGTSKARLHYPASAAMAIIVQGSW
jgi:hypothetical protein